MKFFRKIAAITTAAVMAAGTICVDAFSADTYKLYVSSDPASASIGDTVKISVLIDTPDDGIGGLGYRLVFDTDYLEYQADSAKTSIDANGGFADINIKNASDGWIGLAFAINGARKGDAIESLSVDFKVLKPNAEISLTNIEVLAADEDGTNITNQGSYEEAEFELECSHKNTEKKTTPATCKDDGKEETVCKDCGKTVDTKTLPKTDDHDWGEWETKEDVKCGETADQTRTCKICGTVEKRTGEVVEHIWDNGKVTTEPTCTKDGVKTYTCTRGCGETKTDPIKALGHDLDEGAVTKEPTCTEKGEKTYSCKREDCDYTETEEIDALGHKLPEDKEIINEPTCTEEGEEKGVCERCGEEVTVNIPALGHDWGEWVVTKEATADEDGEQERVCSRCDAKETETIPATGGGTSENEPTTPSSPAWDGGIYEPYIPGETATTTAAEASTTTEPDGTTAAPAQNTTAAPAETESTVANNDDTSAPAQAPNETEAASAAETTAGNVNNINGDNNLNTGIVITIIPAAIAAAGVIITKKKK